MIDKKALKAIFSGFLYLITTTVFSETISFVSDTVCFGDTTTLSAVTNIPENTITSYRWDLDYDGIYETIAGKTVKHVFKSAGNQPVKLNIVASGKENPMPDAKNVFVKPLPVADFEAEYLCEGLPSLIKNKSSIHAPSADFYWDMNNDGITDFSYQNDFSYSFIQTTNTIKLIIENSYSCRDTLIKSVLLNKTPEADFDFTGGKCTGDTVWFTNLSSTTDDPSSKYIWKYGDGGLDVSQMSPYYIYLKPGYYDISLVTVSEHNCSDTVVKSINVKSGTRLELVADKDTIYLNEAAVIEGRGNFVSYQWSTGEQTRQIVVREEGNYYLKATDSDGCISNGMISIVAFRDYNPNKIIAQNGILTPNNDGINDYLVFLNLEAYGENELIIYDQWGAEVQRIKNYQNNWDGKNNRGELLSTGAYFYIIKTRNTIGKGNINILR